MTRSLLSAACHAYATAGVAYLIHLVRLRGRSSTVGALFLALGAALHGAVIAMRYREMVVTPVSSLADGLSFTAWLLVVAFLVLDRIYRLPALGAFVTPLALTVTVSALLVPSAPPGALSSLLGMPGLVAHVCVAFSGMALFALAGGAAVLYLVQERQVKGKRFGFAFSRLPSLEVLDELNRRLVLFGFALLSVTIATGALYAKANWGSYWSWDPKETFSLLAWSIFGALIAARQQGGWRGKRVALLTMAGLIVLVGSWVGLLAFPAGHHGGTFQDAPTASAGGARG
jgi:cytochrome c-type biogenesis protein CcsB